MKPRPYILAETNWRAIKGSRIDLAILPWGATEAHNYHLPYATDSIQAERIAAEAARIAWEQGAKIIVLPTIPIGVNSGQVDILLDLNFNISTQAAILNDIIDFLHRQGIKRFLILNGHGGNNFKPILRELGLKYTDMFLTTCDWFRAVDKKLYFEESGDHADEMETSLMLHLVPELVLPLEQAGEGVERKIKIKGIREGWAWTERKWSEVTPDTGVGNPKKASPEKGRIYFLAVTQAVADLICQLSTIDLDRLYD
ncbi:creatininase family protein [candidate division KSB1 bacterium]|nr:creatininase family protein [candidate division KSB1 bacterium]